MKSVIIALCLVACAFAASPDFEAQVSKYSFDSQPEGAFSYGYETSNGISAQAQGHVETFGKDEVALKVSGVNQWTSPEGEIVRLTYTADENGYNPQGSHLPTPPPPEAIPEYILRAIEYIKTHPYVEKP